MSSSLDLLTEEKAQKQLEELFEQCKTDKLFNSYSLNLTSTTPLEGSSAAYLAHYQLTVKKSQIGAEVRKRVIDFIKQNSCNWLYGGHSDLTTTDAGVSILTLQAEINI